MRPSPFADGRASGCLFVLAALIGLTPTAWAQAPAGPEFQVNTYTTGHQLGLTVAANATGNLVVTWTDSGRGTIVARRYDSAGPRGGEIQVNTSTASTSNTTGAAMDEAGNFVVAWSAYDGSSLDVFARRFDLDGVPLGAPFRVNTTTASAQRNASVAGNAAGAVVVAWNGLAQDGSSFGIFAQRYDPAGSAVGAEFQVNTFTTGAQYRPHVAMGPDGRFVVVWDSFLQDGDGFGIFGQRYDAGGARVGGEFRVNTYTTLHQVDPSVAVAPDGSFVVVWDDDNEKAPERGVAARLFDSDGNPRGVEFAVNASTTGYQESSCIAMDEGGEFVIAWFDFERQDVFAQRYAAAGTPRGGEFRVNTYTTGRQDVPAAASTGAGTFVVAWESYGQDGDVRGVFAQRFGGLLPAALVVDDGGNGVLEPAEAASVAPSWSNFTGAAQTFGGIASDFAGPAGPTYELLIAAADYGTVPSGATQACLECYEVRVTAAARPVRHWDATMVETITPAALGQVKTWVVHVGDSFPDVPLSSPFYRFVETLLHHGVTGGCTADAYCPSASTTRQQMAPFALVAREGLGYAPPACGTPVFPDVPASSPFCRWIEELARRGVVGGCGGGNYCPGDPVGRQEMAIFVLRTLDPSLSPPACTTPLFPDVPASSPFCRWIEELARRGVVTGCGGGNYCPAQPVTREQMSVFIGATFGLTLYGP